jgi:hypothetical protein
MIGTIGIMDQHGTVKKLGFIRGFPIFPILPILFETVMPVRKGSGAV